MKSGPPVHAGAFLLARYRRINRVSSERATIDRPLGLSWRPEGNTMMEINTKSPASFGQRCRALDNAAYAVRQRAIRRGDDLHGWRLSHLMRDASTDAQVNVAERKYGKWLQEGLAVTMSPRRRSTFLEIRAKPVADNLRIK